MLIKNKYNVSVVDKLLNLISIIQFDMQVYLFYKQYIYIIRLKWYILLYINCYFYIFEVLWDKKD